MRCVKHDERLMEFVGRRKIIADARRERDPSPKLVDPTSQSATKQHREDRVFGKMCRLADKEYAPARWRQEKCRGSTNAATGSKCARCARPTSDRWTQKTLAAIRGRPAAKRSMISRKFKFAV